MIVGERIVEVSGNKIPKANIKGLNINIQLEDVKMGEENLEINYIYTANYEENVGQIRIRGVLLAREEPKRAKDIADTWKNKKRVPEDYASVVLSAVNYSGSANGTLLARVLGLTAPLIPPKIQLSKGDAAAQGAPAAKK